MTEYDAQMALARLTVPLRLTLAGLWAERLVRAFWPLWTLLIAVLAALAFGVQDHLPLTAVWGGLGMAAVAGFAALFKGFGAFKRPLRAEALARLDATLPGQPIAALTDVQAIGSHDPASIAVWQAHRARMAARAAQAQPVSPDLRLSSRDPFALRYVALTALVMALAFGSLWRVASVTGLSPAGDAAAMAAGPSWEAWAKPPAHTGKPALYLNDITAEALALPQGSWVQVRLYGEAGALSLLETVSGNSAVTKPADPAAPLDFTVQQSGSIAIDGAGGRAWVITALPDTAPTIRTSGEISREADGSMNLPFSASDDYGIASGQATITLNLAAIDRIYGLTVDPEPRPPVILDLPLPISGDRATFDENLIDDLSEHAFANLPVMITLQVTDAMGQTGQTPPVSLILPGKRFFDPLAAAIIEMRRDLLWARSNAPRASQILKAVTHQPEDLIRNDRAYLLLRVAMRRLEAEADRLTPQVRDELAEALWKVALLVEEGDLASAQQRLQRAQDRLDEAIRNGADQAEIDQLMQEMREALADYMNQLAEEALRNPDSQMSENQNSMEMTGDQLQQLLDELQKAIEEGRTADAARMMEMLRQLMENMQVTQGPGGQGGPGQQAMRDLQDTLRGQQDLSDDAFRDLQDKVNPPQPGQGQPGQQPGEGQQGQDGEGQDGVGQGETGDPRSLAERQRDLRNRLDGLNGNRLPGPGTDPGEAGRQALDEAGRAMNDAEKALRDGDLSGALDRQADAMEAMREGMRQLGEAQAEAQRQQNGDQRQATNRADPGGALDPLGREQGNAARLGSDRNLLQGQDVYRRAQNLLEEIRRRSGDLARPSGERDYLRRLLDMF
ncbi:TIGR02302 family protein [Rhodobacter ferrooxidans]|uniref:TIGR02302 family protein n=1 Tax=Rhodobacter ferrooxidans TaxID=371731 RepID=C8S2D1_9RHOB|nr:TIGR02302 family protein [Rhodobacter sp. SW2]EEW24802.1 conserved hypothetical protein [Rhodobacter sp. SW2]